MDPLNPILKSPVSLRTPQLVFFSCISSLNGSPALSFLKPVLLSSGLPRESVYCSLGNWIPHYRTHLSDFLSHRDNL